MLTRADAKEPLRWARLARIAAEAKAGKEAKTYINLAIGYLSDVNYGADFELVRALLLTGQASRAMKHLENLVKDNSQNNWLWKTLVDTAMNARSYEIALIAIGRLKALPYLDPEFRYCLGVTERTASKQLNTGWAKTVQHWLLPLLPRT